MKSNRKGDSKQSTTDSMVANLYKIGKTMTSGPFSKIYNGKNKETGESVAIKLELKEQESAQLHRENEFYKILGNQTDGIPKVYFYGPFNRYNALVFDLLGKNLEQVFNNCNRQFSLKTIIHIMIQILNRIEFVHNKQLIYRNVKPENFLLGLSGTDKENVIHMIDFGLAKRYIDPKTNTHIPMKEGKDYIGTARYMSLNAHKGKELSRRDDLESIGFMIIYFVKQGKLEWSRIPAKTQAERLQKIEDYKKRLGIEKLCNGLPEAFPSYFRKVRSLDFEETPDYEYLKSLFAKLFASEKFKDNNFDWNKKKTQ